MSTARAAIDCSTLKDLIREVPDFPKPGILFYDITTLLKDKTGFAMLIDALSEHYLEKNIDLILGIEARGFIFGPALAYRLNAGFVPIRKPRKLPAETARVTYQLEYGSDTVEIHKDAIRPGQRVLIVDDNIDSAETLRLWVETLGHEVATVHDGEAALDAIGRLQPDLVFLDPVGIRPIEQPQGGAGDGRDGKPYPPIHFPAAPSVIFTMLLTASVSF